MQTNSSRGNIEALKQAGWLAGLMGVMVVGLAVLVTTRVNPSHNDVVETFWLLEAAALAGNVVEFESLLSERDRAWVESQVQLMADELWLFPGRGLDLLSSNNPTTIHELTYTAGGASATLIIEQTYTLSDTYRVTLHRPLVFESGLSGWRLAPPDETFWGRTKFFSGDRMGLQYPELESAWAERFAEDFDVLLTEKCRVVAELRCHSHFQVLHFHNDMTELYNLEAQQYLRERPPPMLLPSPALIGWPTDEMSYRALLQGYSSHISCNTWFAFLHSPCPEGGFIDLED